MKQLKLQAAYKKFLMIALILVAAVGVAVSTPSVAQNCVSGQTSPCFQGLGFLRNNHYSAALGVSADGNVVVGTDCDPTVPGSGDCTGGPGQGFQGFRWTSATGMVGIGFLPGYDRSSARRANSDGSIIAGTGGTGTGLGQAFRWVNGSITGLGFLPGDNISNANAVSSGGAVVVGGSIGNSNYIQQAYRWVNGTMTGLGFLGGNSATPQSLAINVNADGTVVVGQSTSIVGSFQNFQAFRWVNGSMTGLGFLNPSCNPNPASGECTSSATAVSADGSVVVGSSNDNSTGSPKGMAFRWANGTMTGLGFLPSFTAGSGATAVSADGSVVVGQSTGAAFNNHIAFRWTPSDGMKSVEELLTAVGVSFAGWSLERAMGVSADGTVIVGFGIDPAGKTQGWIARLGPPPGAPKCTVTFTPTDTPFGQPARNLAVTPRICQTNPTTGACINPTSPGPSSTVKVAANETVYFSTFVTGKGTLVPYDPANNRIFIIATEGSVPVGESSAAVKMLSSGSTLAPPLAAPDTNIVSAVAPNARTTTPGKAVTAFGTIINAGAATATACSIALPVGVPASFLYQTTDSTTNNPTGSPNTPANIAAGQRQSYYFAITPTTTFALDIPMVFACGNTNPAPTYQGLNTFLLTSNTTQIADMLSISDTQTHDGIMIIPSPTGTGLIVTAAINIGSCTGAAPAPASQQTRR